MLPQSLKYFSLVTKTARNIRGETNPSAECGVGVFTNEKCNKLPVRPNQALAEWAQGGSVIRVSIAFDVFIGN